MAETLVIHPERCTACRACELACSMKHRGEFNPSRSRIQVNVFLEDALYIPTACTQCDAAKRHHVIIGASAAGLAALEAIRSVDRACQVTVLSKERPRSIPGSA